MFQPKEIAENYIEIGHKKASTPVSKVLVLAFMAGLFVALTAAGVNTAVAAVGDRAGLIVAACIFPAALTMVLLAGSELFTGNTLLVIPLLCGKISWRVMLRNWLFVYIGNFLGSMAALGLYLLSGQMGLMEGGVALVTMQTAAIKLSFSFPQALALGVACNVLVCVAVWISFSAKTTSGKILGLYLPIVIFVMCEFEHCIANMYYIPAGIAAAQNPAFAGLALSAGIDTAALNWGAFLLKSLLPVTIGNILGGSVLIGLPYWFIYLRNSDKKT